jgi:hypothetical protein
MSIGLDSEGLEMHSLVQFRAGLDLLESAEFSATF